MLDRLGQPHPALELGLRWLEQRRPTSNGTTLVHGDFRTGNLLSPRTTSRPSSTGSWSTSATPSRTWAGSAPGRGGSGATTRRAGSAAGRSCWAAYEAAGGHPVDPDAARWWEVYGNLRWGVITVTQASVHLLGITRSMELAAIGRRTAETEHDVLALVAPDQEPPAPTPVVAPTGAPHDRPTAVELAEAIEEWLRGDLTDGTEGRLRFHARVAANAVAVAAA